MLPLGFVAYLLTFCCYGTRLRGDEKGSVDRAREGRRGPLEASAKLVSYGKRTMTHAEAGLDFGESILVLSAIRETCAFRHWTLLAAVIGAMSFLLGCTMLAVNCTWTAVTVFWSHGKAKS